jgi:phosphopantetheinyl transferase
MLAGLILSRREREAYRALNGIAKRRLEWLLGRAAAKDAVRRLVREHGGEELCPADVEILSDANGRPHVDGAWRSRTGLSPVVSITHAGGVAAALAALDRRMLVGIDLERLSDRRGGFDRLAFTPPEQALLGHVPPDERLEWNLRLWCAKEAVGKALGRGFANGLHSIRVTDARFDDGVVTLEVADGLRGEFPEFNGRLLTTWTIRDGDYVSSAVACER